MIEKILENLKDKKNILILTHNNPDPDSMGSAFGMKFIITKMLNKRVSIAYRGLVCREDNKELIKQCRIKMLSSDDIDFAKYDYTIVVDSQPGFGNIYIPDNHRVDVTLDHHLIKDNLNKYPDIIKDIKEGYGSTCTIVTSYIVKLSIEPDENTATALCLGITTDAIGNARNSCQKDKDMLGFLYPFVSLEKIAKIQTPEKPSFYYETIKRAIDNSIIYGGKNIICNLKEVKNTELVAEAADYIVSMKGIETILVMGYVGKMGNFSMRFKSSKKSAGRIATLLVKDIGYGGGHMKSAGGQVPLDTIKYSEAIKIMTNRFIDNLDIDPKDSKKIV